MNLPRIQRCGPESGFSLVELLVAAFIMAVGLLGLAALETVSLKSNTRARGYNTAVLVASQVLDAAETQARQTIQTQSQGGTVVYPTNDYFGAVPVVEQFTFRGAHLNANSADPVDKTTFFTASTTSVNAGNYAGAIGRLVVVTTVVTFQEALSNSGPLVTRTVTLTRNINHA